MRPVNPHELEYILASANPSNEDQRNLQEKYENLVDYMSLFHKPARASILKERAHSFALFDNLDNLDGLRRRIENYASIHHIPLSR